MSRGWKLTITAIISFLIIIIIGGLIIARIISGYVSPTKATQILLTRHPSAYVTEIDTETLGTKFIYEVDFVLNNTEHTAKIDRKTGDIVYDTAKNIPDSSQNKIPVELNIQSATEIAIKDAGLNVSEVTVTKAELENSDGNAVYKIDFIYDTIEYEYILNSETGAIESISSRSVN